jgi:molybdenum cofactor cytidylyltransferase
VISGVVLAAGTASRFGSTKQLAEFRGKPLVQHAVDLAVEAGLGEIVVVLGHDADRVRAVLRLPGTARAVRNDRYAKGQSTSLSAGLRALDPATEAAVVLLADQPGVRVAEIRAMTDRFAETRAPLVRLRYRDAPGPALLAREIWPEAIALTGDVGARVLFDRFPIEEVDVHRDAPLDVDTPGDVERERQ